MSNEDEFEEGLRQILSNNPSPQRVRKEITPESSEPSFAQPEEKVSGNKFVETLIRIAAALIALGLLVMFGLQFYQR